MKKAGLIVGGILVLVVIAILVVPLVVDVNQYRGVIETRLEQQLGREVTLGAMSLGLFPPRFQVEEPVISEDPGFGDRPPFIRADHLDVRVRLFPLLRGEVSISSLDLERPSVELVRNAQGAWNFRTLGEGAGDEPALAGPSTGEPAGRAFTLDRLRIRDGQVAVTHLGAAETRTVYDHIDLTLSDYAPGQPFSLDLAAHIQGEGTQELRLSGEGGPLVAEDPLSTPFRGTLGLDEVGIEGLQAFLQTEMLSGAEGSLSGESEIVNQAGGLDATGNIELEGARLKGLDIGYPITADYDAGAQLSEGLFTIRSATLRLGDTPLSVSGSVSTATAPASLDLDIQSGEADITEIARLASAFGVAFPPDAEVTGRVSVDVHVSGSTARPALNGTIAGRDLQVSGANIPRPVQVSALDLTLSPAAIRSNEFEARSGETTATARFTLEGYGSENPRIDAGIRAPGATLPDIQSIARAYGITGLDRIEGEGLLDVDLRASGPLESVGSEAVLRALDGDIRLDFSPLKLSGLDASRELGAIGGFTAGSEGPNLTEILHLTGQIAVRNGIARTDDLRAELAIGNLTAAGTADLAAETLDMQGLAVFSKAFTESVGGTSVGGYLNTALTNEAGELVIPFLVVGSLREPRFAPDVDTLAQMHARRLLPQLDDPASAVSDLLDRFTRPSETGAEAGEEAGAQEEEPARPEDQIIRDILGGFLGGRTPEEAPEDEEPQ